MRRHGGRWERDYRLGRRRGERELTFFIPCMYLTTYYLPFSQGPCRNLNQCRGPELEAECECTPTSMMWRSSGSTNVPILTQLQSVGTQSNAKTLPHTQWIHDRQLTRIAGRPQHYSKDLDRTRRNRMAWVMVGLVNLVQAKWITHSFMNRQVVSWLPPPLLSCSGVSIHNKEVAQQLTDLYCTAPPPTLPWVLLLSCHSCSWHRTFYSLTWSHQPQGHNNRRGSGVRYVLALGRMILIHCRKGQMGGLEKAHTCE